HLALPGAVSGRACLPPTCTAVLRSPQKIRKISRCVGPSAGREKSTWSPAHFLSRCDLGRGGVDATVNRRRRGGVLCRACSNDKLGCHFAPRQPIARSRPPALDAVLSG